MEKMQKYMQRQDTIDSEETQGCMPTKETLKRTAVVDKGYKAQVNIQDTSPISNDDLCCHGHNITYKAQVDKQDTNPISSDECCLQERNTTGKAQVNLRWNEHNVMEKTHKNKITGQVNDEYTPITRIDTTNIHEHARRAAKQVTFPAVDKHKNESEFTEQVSASVLNKKADELSKQVTVSALVEKKCPMNTKRLRKSLSQAYSNTAIR